MENMKLSNSDKHAFLRGIYLNLHLNTSIYMYARVYDMKVSEGLLGGRKEKGETETNLACFLMCRSYTNICK